MIFFSLVRRYDVKHSWADNLLQCFALGPAQENGELFCGLFFPFTWSVNILVCCHLPDLPQASVTEQVSSWPRGKSNSLGWYSRAAYSQIHRRMQRCLHGRTDNHENQGT